MTQALQALGIDKLSVEDRIRLVQEIWDSIAADVEQSPLSEAQRLEVDRRLAAHSASPQAGTSWEQVEADALARLRQ